MNQKEIIVVTPSLITYKLGFEKYILGIAILKKNI